MRYADIKEGGKEVERMLKDTNKMLRVSATRRWTGTPTSTSSTTLLLMVLLVSSRYHSNFSWTRSTPSTLPRLRYCPCWRSLWIWSRRVLDLPQG